MMARAGTPATVPARLAAQEAPLTGSVSVNDDLASRPLLDHRDLLSSAEALGALPTTVTRLAAVVSDPGHQISDIVEVVSFDQSLTATLLRRANARVGSRVQIRTVREAAMWLGSGALLSLAMATNVSRRLKEPVPAYGLAEGQLWKQSVAAALAVDTMRDHAGADLPEEATTAALLHDFGKFVLVQHLGTRVLNLLGHAAAADNLGLLDAERAVFGVNHADIGGLVAQHWRLPHTIVEGIIHHHQTEGHRSTVGAAVSLAHAMVPEILAATGGDEPLPIPCERGLNPRETHAAIMRDLGIDPTSYGDLLTAARSNYVALASRYEVA